MRKNRNNEKIKIQPVKKKNNLFTLRRFHCIFIACLLLYIGEGAYYKYQAKHNGIILRGRIISNCKIQHFRGAQENGFRYRYYYNGKRYEEEEPQSTFYGEFGVGDSINVQIYPSRPGRPLILDP